MVGGHWGRVRLALRAHPTIDRSDAEIVDEASGAAPSTAPILRAEERCKPAGFRQRRRWLPRESANLVHQVRLIRKSTARCDVGAALDAKRVERALESRDSTEESRRQPDLFAKAPFELSPAEAVGQGKALD